MDGARVTVLLLALHIAAMVVWCGTQLLLPLLIRDLHAGVEPWLQRAAHRGEQVGMPRYLFTRVTTPAALLAILSGTVVFLLNRTVEVWLLLKLVLAALLVVTLALTGWLLLGAARMPARQLLRCCNLLMLVPGLLMLTIFWVVLSKPFAELLP